MAGLKFGWKRKAGSKIDKTTTLFPASSAETDDVSSDLDWLTSVQNPKRRVISLEDGVSKSKRLKHEGCVLAEAERFWEAIKKWDEALQLTPDDERILDMKAQALTSLHEVFPALQTAQRVVTLAPNWWVGHQTLGRALVNMGEVKMALRSFSRAIHLNPGEEELWREDLLWCKSLLDRKNIALVAESEEEKVGSVTVTELVDSDSNASKENVMFDSENSAVEQANVRRKEIRRIPKNYVQMRDPI